MRILQLPNRNFLIVLVATSFLLIVYTCFSGPSTAWASARFRPVYLGPLRTVTSDLDASQCVGFPDTSDILVVLKTGATEAYEKLPIHLSTTLRCVNSSVIFGDLEMDMGGHHIHDLLTSLSADITLDNPDFDLYRQQKEAEALYGDQLELRKGKNGWNLDKYKFMPMMRRSFEHQPTAPWYLFLEADTGIVWANIRAILDKFDPKQKLYLGRSYFNEWNFAHGGTGFAVSNAAMRALVLEEPPFENNYTNLVRKHCCGDTVLAKVFLDRGIPVTGLWPVFSEEKPNIVPFSQHHWCGAVGSMHHMTPSEIGELFSLVRAREQQGKGNETLIWRDIYLHYFAKNLVERRSNWINIAKDVLTIWHGGDTERINDERGPELGVFLPDNEIEAKKSPEKCKAFCDETEECMMWLHSWHGCRLGRTFRLGQSEEQEKGVEYTSGWNLTRIEAKMAELGDCTKGEDPWWFMPILPG
jgi:hypothetical protein